MKRLFQKKGKAGFAGMLAAIVLCMFAAGTAHAVGTTTGQVIQNQATATYEDENGNSYSAQSNLATITVAQKYTARLGTDNLAVTGAAGQAVNFAHTLENLGNGTETFDVRVTDRGAALTGAAVFLDTNKNGVVDSGETQIASVGTDGTVTVAADEQVSLVVKGTIPGGTATGTDLGVTLRVLHQGVNDSVTGDTTVDDITAGDGADGAEGTNEDNVNVTSNAVLNINKSSTYNVGANTNDISDDTVTYVVTISNTGQSPAYDVEIQDVLDLSRLDVSAIGDITVTNTSGNFEDTAGNPDENGGDDTVEGFAPAATNDADNDGTTGDFGVRGHDDVLPANTTVSFTYTVPVVATLAAGTQIDNAAQVIGDVDNDNDADDSGETVTSNVTSQTVPQTYGVTVADTGVGDAAGVNDGGDDDGAENGVQLVDTAASGEVVLFKNVITNDGNGTDTFELSIQAGHNYPSGTVFSFYNATGTSELADSNLDGTKDTGPLASGASVTIMVKAQLPAGAYDDDGTNMAPFDATLVGTSKGLSSESDSATERLADITPPGTDLANSANDNDPLADQDSYSVGGTTPTSTNTANLGETTTFDLYIQNDSGVPDSFQLSAGGSWNGAAMGALPTGWNVVFKTTGGTTITTTPAISGGGSYQVVAHVTVPNAANASQAEEDHAADIDNDAVDETVDGNGDGDGDYAIFFRVVSVNTAASDIKMDAVDVNPFEELAVVPNQNGQIQPGGSIDHTHTVRNDGNTVESITLEGENSRAASGWGNNILVDTNNDGNPDKAFANLLAADNVYYRNASGTLVAQAFGADGTIELGPGEQLPVIARVFAPSSAPDGTVDQLTVTANYDIGTDDDTATATDRTTVILGQLRLTKTVALDVDCDGTADTAFAQTSLSDAKPGECAIWRIVVENQGTATASNVVITDSIPSYSTFEAGSLASGAGDAGTAIVPAVTLDGNTDADDDENGAHDDDYSGSHVAGTITFYIGSGADQPNAEGGSIGPGETVSMQFRSQVD